MVIITINSNLDNRIFIENAAASNYINKLTIINNYITYDTHQFKNNLCYSYHINYYTEKAEYYKRFHIYNSTYFFSHYIIYKNFLYKKQMLNIKIIIYNILFYSYFICNKYYTNGNIKNYNIISITSKKLFNSRDLYKIYSYI